MANQHNKLQDEEDNLRYFSVDTEKLYGLFAPDNIRDKVSNKHFKELSSINGLINYLKTDLKKGLDNDNAEDFQKRREFFSTNAPIVKEPHTIWELIMECFEDLMLRILVIASIVSSCIGVINDGWQTGWLEGATILLAVVIIVSVQSGNAYVKEQQFMKLNAKREEKSVHLLRQGRLQYIDIKEILVGDILSVQIGDMLQIDGILIEGSEILMDESSVTGESDLIKKQPATQITESEGSCFIVSGSKIMDGSGRVLVCAVGVNTQLGKLKLMLQEENPPTPLQQKLESIAEDIGKVGTIAASMTMLALLVHLVVNIILGNHCGLCVETLQDIVKSFLIAVTIIVVAVPEGLPLAVTIALAYSVNKMKDENNLVKQLASCETMGGATNVCSDKTGTLTQNLMTVTKIYINDKLIEKDADKDIPQDKVPSDLRKQFGECVCVNSSANPKKGVKWEQIGSKTECALLELAYRFGTDFEPYRQNTEKCLKVIPFNSARKKMITLYKLNNNVLRIYVKGATEVVLEKCNMMYTEKQKMQLDAQKKAWIKTNIIEFFANSALRTLGIAYKDMDFNFNTNDIETLTDNMMENDLTLVAIAGIQDPLRPEIPGAIKTCAQAGIIVRMVTGDNLNTAVAIAKNAGILQKDDNMKNYSTQTSYEVLEGKKFRELVGGLIYEHPNAKKVEDRGKPMISNFNMFKQIAKEMRVLARSTPEDKYILVTGLLQAGEVVAVTGDGTNDAPALKKADVGFAMGIAGTEVAKEAAGIILLDDNFASIITACKYGRNIYDSIRKFIQFQLTVNAVALFMCFLGATVLKESPLNSIEMLWVNLIMDTFASLALSTEPPSDILLQRKPYGRTESIVTPNMWRNIFGQSIYQIVALSLLLFKAPEWLNIPSSIGMEKYDEQKAVHFTIFFQSFVLMQVFNEINARKLERSQINIFEGLCNNFIFWMIIIVTFVVQTILVQFGGIYVGVSALTQQQHLLCIIIGAGSIIVGLLIKLLPNAIFNKINLFREEALNAEQMDNTFTSMMRRKSSVRLNLSHQKRDSTNIQPNTVSLHSGVN